MFNKIMVPVDLAHTPSLSRSLELAAQLARQNGATVWYVGITADTPGKLGHTPAEYAERLDAFTASQVETHGHDAASTAYVANDPAIDLTSVLLRAATEIEADLIVMATHGPGVTDRLWPSHGEAIARRFPGSVFLVRQDPIHPDERIAT
ncbi:universal stress protein [Poseidonocella sp. HB161398]|uniref:universal stress protein n=1 Tax=Poseidonocella sp. HB161398 TaxID=2320855 RepID=UPI0011095CAD|nr:universal stress protein [Poseidonocella sp. HB161398]